MTIVKGKLYNLTIADYTFPVLTRDSQRALDFYKTVFPDQTIEPIDVLLVENIYLKSTLEETFKKVKQDWANMKLLQAEPGSIKFNSRALDLLLDNQEVILTNTR